MMNTTIPCLPCESLDETLKFWQILGSEVTYRQKAPNPYGVIERDGYALHFFGLTRLPPQDNFSMCLVMAPDIELLHAEFAECLRGAFGKVLFEGPPADIIHAPRSITGQFLARHEAVAELPR